MRFTLPAVVGALLAFSSPAVAAVRYVDENATVSVNDGSSWCDAFLTLQDALAVAVATDEIRVADGTYYPDEGGSETPGDRSATFQLINGVTINGGYAGCGAPVPDARDISTNETILSGDIAQNDTAHACTADSPDCDSNGGRCLDTGFCITNSNNLENSLHVVTGNGVDATAVLDGFIVTAGLADGAAADGSAAGIRLNTGSPTIVDCRIEGHSATGGAGALIGSGTPTFRGCTFSANKTIDWGGACYIGGGPPRYENCVFESNTAGSVGGAIAVLTAANPIMVGCTFRNNTANNGAAAYVGNAKSATFVNCTLIGNSTSGVGGGASVWGTLTVVNSVCSGNSAGSGGCLRANSGGAVVVTNSSLSTNSATLAGGIHSNSGTVTVSNCILWGNSDGSGTDETAQISGSGTIDVNYSLVQGLTGALGGTGNIDGDPIFVDPDGPDNTIGTEDDNLRIKAGSPARDAGDSTAVPADAADLDGDLDTTEPTPLDLDGNDRFVDDLATVDTGVAASPVVDMGAYEAPSAVLFVDVDAAGADDGTSWTDAYTTLQDALADARITGGSASEIWVAAGTYYPDEGGSAVADDRSETFQLVNGVTIFGGFAGTETDLGERDIVANETILSGDITQNDTAHACTADSPDCDSNGAVCLDGWCIIDDNNAENAYHVVTGSGTAATGILDGFTITAGNADGVSGDESGGGLLINGGNPTITDCTFQGNNAVSGSASSMASSSSVFTGCTFLGNSVQALYNIAQPGFAVTLTACTFESNPVGFRQNSSGGAGTTLKNCIFTLNRKGGLRNNGGNVVAIGCAFDRNSGDARGAGMDSTGTATLIGCRFTGNATTVDGGGLSIGTGSAEVTNCYFSGNSARVGGGLWNQDTSTATMITNCTFTGNTATLFDGGGIYAVFGAPAVVENCIVWGNTDQVGVVEAAQIRGPAVVNHSLVQGLTGVLGGTGNIDGDPLFVDADGPDNVLGTDDDNLRISACSPAIDAGDNDALPLDTFDLDEDLNTAEPLPYDIFNRTRRIEDPLTSDTGNAGTPGTPIVDMGAFEFAPPLYVDADATGINNGRGWLNAYHSLQDALTDPLLIDGVVTEVWVAAGTYMPDGGYKPVGGVHNSGSGDRNATFQLRSGLGLYGGFDGTELCRDPRDRQANETVLSGDLSGDDVPVVCAQDSPDCDSFGGQCLQDSFCIVKQNNGENSYHVVTASGTDAATTIDGFRIEAGNATSVDPLDRGAGLYNDAGVPSILNCAFTRNWADFGAGIYNDFAAPTVAECTFNGNRSQFNGGGIYNDNSNPTVTHCAFTENRAPAGAGGGMHNVSSRPTVTNCMFRSNSAGGGGGLFNVLSSARILDCTFAANTAFGDGGGLINTSASNSTVINCLFTGNTALGTAGGGGAIKNDVDSSPILTNCTFSENSANGNGGGIWNATIGINSPVLTNCILWGNIDDANASAGGPFMDESAQIHTASGTPVVKYSIVQGGWTGAGGTGNSSSDPMFVDADGPDNIPGTKDDNLHLESLSPAVDAGDNDSVPADMTDLDGDGDTTETLPVDLDDSPRILEDLLVADVGNAGALGTPIVDLGAYEFLRDCNGNGIADDQDISNCAGTPNCADCNANDIPDGCDIAGCDFLGTCTALVCVGGYNDGAACTTDADCQLSCNDCDLNGVPDGCDDPVDNIPDSCVQAISSGSWSADIWGLSGSYPDNVNSAPDKNVTLDNVAVVLDVAAEIPTLQLTNGATLDGSSSALTIVGNTASPLRAPGDPTETIIGPGSTYTVSELTATTILVFGDDPFRGTLLAKSDCAPPTVCNITAESLAVDGGGIYQQVGTGSTMPLTADSVTLSGGRCGAAGGGNGVVGGGEINLYDGMTITTIKDLPAGKTGDFIINGSETADCFGALRGLIPPPKLGIGCSAGRGLRSLPGIVIGGNFIVTGIARISISSTPCGLSRALLPDQIVQLQGDLINQSTAPDFFDWETGGITLNGLSPQRFEVAGEDIGETVQGFNVPGAVGSNFSMGTVEIAPGADVTFVDEFDNDGKPQGLEALYIHELVLGAGATVTVDNCKVYYGMLNDQGATINFLRSGALAEQSAIVSAPLSASYPHDRRKNRYISFDPNKTAHDGKNVAFKVELAAISLGSCDGATGGEADFCRSDRGADDCNACSGGGNACINASIDCNPGDTCDGSGETCVNDAPNTGGSNVGRIWWVGPESPLLNGVHLLVSEPFRTVSTDWPNPVHVGDCEVVPEAVYGVRAVGATGNASGLENESDELPVETTLFATASSSWWGDCVGPLKKFCGGDIRTPECTSDADCAAPATCDRAWTLPDGSVNFDDVNAALALVAPGANSVVPDVTWVDLHGNASGTPGSQAFDPPNFILNFADIGQILSGFGGFPYKGYDPADCPDVGTWP